jgi:outer-membrane receptor for ferric coprogen and ferric-rhodotorulic acid
MKKNKRLLFLISISTIFALQNNLLADTNLENYLLDTINVHENKLSFITEDTDSYTTGLMNSSTKLDLSIKETPQTISVLTTQELEDKNITSYQKMLDEIPGVTLNRQDESVYASARGFEIDYFKIDGMSQYGFISSRDLDLSIYDRVEIVKGANGLTTGSGNPAMSMNFVRKHANSKVLKGNLLLSAGSWNNYSSIVDISTPLNEDKNIRARVIVKHQEEDSFMDKYKKEKNLLYGIVDADLSDTTFLSIGASYEDLDKNGVAWGGLPAFDSNGNRIDFDRSKSVTEDWTYWDMKTTSVFTNLQQYITDQISLNSSYTYTDMDEKSKLLWFTGKVNTNDGSGISAKAYEDVVHRTDENFDFNLKAPFNVLNLDQESILGFSYSKYSTLKNDVAYMNGWNAITIPNFYNYSINEIYPLSSEVIIRPLNHVTQTAFYVNQKLSLHERLKLILGARLSKYTLINEDTRYDSRTFENQLTPYAGMVYEINDQHSIYVSYTDIFQPQSQKDINDKYLDPIIGKSYETGVKGEYFDGKLNTSFSLFKIIQDNVAQKIDGVLIPGTSSQAFRAARGVESKGIEINLTGKITTNMNINLGLANFTAKEANGDKFSTDSARTTANLFATYKIQKFKLGAGANYKSRYYEGEGKNLIEQKGFILINTLIAYELNKNSNIQLNVNNLFDKKYYEGLGSDGMIYGSPRNATLTYKYTF